MDDAATIPDERLELIFTCCHPALAPGVQVALTLRSAGGPVRPAARTVARSSSPRPKPSTASFKTGWPRPRPPGQASRLNRQGRGLAGLRRFVDGAFAQIGEVARGGHEVLVVVDHHEVMVRSGGADQEVHG